jgi:hypothetical protein
MKTYRQKFSLLLLVISLPLSLLVLSGSLAWPMDQRMYGVQRLQAQITPTLSNSLVIGGDVVTTPVQIDTVRIVIPLIYPAMIHLDVYGQRVIGVEVEVRQERKGEEVIVMMTQTYSRDTAVRLSPFRQSVVLQGSFAPGTYTLRVNEYVTTFEVGAAGDSR